MPTLIRHSRIRRIKTLSRRFLTVLLSIASIGMTLTAHSDLVNETHGVAAKGYDVVAYFDGVAQEGSNEHSELYDNVHYHFSNNSNLLRFKKSPETYLPAYGGYCAYAMLEGEKIDINPKRFKIIEGKLYLFYHGFLGNTLKKWNKLLEQSSENKLIEQANNHWQHLQNQ